MTLQEAIGRAKNYMDCVDEDGPVEFDNTILLLIKAGEREIGNRENPDFVMVGSLAGETEE